MDNVFGNRLVSARKMAGMSLQDLADRLKNVVTKQSLNKYEQGKILAEKAYCSEEALHLSAIEAYFNTVGIDLFNNLIQTIEGEL